MYMLKIRDTIDCNLFNSYRVRFDKMARLLARLQDPNIVSLLGACPPTPTGGGERGTEPHCILLEYMRYPLNCMLLVKVLYTFMTLAGGLGPGHMLSFINTLQQHPNVIFGQCLK